MFHHIQVIWNIWYTKFFIWTTRSFDVYRIFLFVLLNFTSTNFNKFFDMDKMEIIKICEVQGQIMRWQDKFSKRITILTTRYLFLSSPIKLDTPYWVWKDNTAFAKSLHLFLKFTVFTRIFKNYGVIPKFLKQLPEFF